MCTGRVARLCSTTLCSKVGNGSERERGNWRVGIFRSLSKIPREETGYRGEERRRRENNHFGAGKKKERRVTVIAARKKISERGRERLLRNRATWLRKLFLLSTVHALFAIRYVRASIAGSINRRGPPNNSRIILELIFDSSRRRKREVHPDFDFFRPSALC